MIAVPAFQKFGNCVHPFRPLACLLANQTAMERKETNTISRRKFVSSLGLAGAISLPAAKAVAFSELPTPRIENGAIMKCGPYLQAADEDTMTIRWITHTRCYSWVEYGESPDKLDQKAQRVNEGLIEANNTVQAITLKNLSPGKTYYYRVMSRNIDNFHPYKLKFGDTYAGDVFSFITPTEEKRTVEFLVFNDVHDRPETFPSLLKYQGESKPDFVFLNGDMFNWQEDENQLVDHLLKPLCNAFASHTPFIFSRGNHEARGRFARQIADYFDGKSRKFFYSFQRGPLYAIVLDSGEDKDDSHAEYAGLVCFDEYRLQQKEWLEKEIRKKAFRNAKYRIVFSHIPFYNSGKGHGTLHCREHWGPLLNKGKVDLLISGHTHRHGIHPPVAGEHNYPIVIGGGKRDGSRTIMKVKVTDDALNLTMTDDSGTNVGTLAL